MARPISVLDVIPEEKRELERRVGASTTPARDCVRAHIVLLRSEGVGQHEVASRLGVSAPSVSKWAQRFDRLRSVWQIQAIFPAAASGGRRFSLVRTAVERFGFFSRNVSRSLSLFAWLHGWQAQTMLPMLVGPLRLRGTTWSSSKRVWSFQSALPQ